MNKKQKKNIEDYLLEEGAVEVTGEEKKKMLKKILAHRRKEKIPQKIKPINKTRA